MTEIILFKKCSFLQIQKFTSIDLLSIPAQVCMNVGLGSSGAHLQRQRTTNCRENPHMHEETMQTSCRKFSGWDSNPRPSSSRAQAGLPPSCFHTFPSYLTKLAF
ncbi:hypothetical protein ILYODFUR_017454 [Ilyodon furcidens]|uniref:Uncharacterized protein n=1 Tax=Ilyodon furcidens TaxID=33524 RepID=A0ABV0U648_9TELE